MEVFGYGMTGLSRKGKLSGAKGCFSPLS